MKFSFMTLLKISITLFCLILIFIGFALGYIYNDYKSGACREMPFSYGINKLNDMNDAEFTCSCKPIFGDIKPFSFDKDGLTKNELFIITP